MLDFTDGETQLPKSTYHLELLLVASQPVAASAKPPKGVFQRQEGELCPKIHWIISQSRPAGYLLFLGLPCIQNFLDIQHSETVSGRKSLECLGKPDMATHVKSQDFGEFP